MNLPAVSYEAPNVGLLEVPEMSLTATVTVLPCATAPLVMFKASSLTYDGNPVDDFTEVWMAPKVHDLSVEDASGTGLPVDMRSIKIMPLGWSQLTYIGAVLKLHFYRVADYHRPYTHYDSGEGDYPPGKLRMAVGIDISSAGWDGAEWVEASKKVGAHNVPPSTSISGYDFLPVWLLQGKKCSGGNSGGGYRDRECDQCTNPEGSDQCEEGGWPIIFGPEDDGQSWPLQWRRPCASRSAPRRSRRTGST